MKNIGLLCGLSWHSTNIYYEVINRMVMRKLGGIHSAPIMMNNLDAYDVYYLMKNNALPELAALLIREAKKLEKAGVDTIALACNSVHAVYQHIQDALNVPLVHIIEPISKKLVHLNVRKVGILATQFSVQQKIYSNYLSLENFSILYPSDRDIALIDRMIFGVCIGRANPLYEKYLYGVIAQLVEDGAEAIVLGCTELGLIANKNVDVPIFDSAKLHAEEIARLSLGLKPAPLKIVEPHPMANVGVLEQAYV